MLKWNMNKMMNTLKRRETFLIILAFIILLSGIRLTWYSIQKPIEHPYVHQGILDLRGWAIPNSRTIPLSGEWALYPSQLLTPTLLADLHAEAAYIDVPGAWNEAFPAERDNHYMYGTYRLELLLDEGLEQDLQLRIYEINNAAVIYINGELVARNGIPSDLESRYHPADMPLNVMLPMGEERVEILIQAADHTGQGGIGKAIHFGTVEAIQKRNLISIGSQLFLCLVFLIHGLYACMLYLLGATNRGLKYFASLIFCGILSIISVDDKLLYEWLPMLPYELQPKITLLTYVGVMTFIPLVLKHIFPLQGYDRLLRWFLIYSAGYALFILIAPSQFTLPSFSYLFRILYIAAIGISIYMLRSVSRGQPGTLFLLLSCVSLGNNLAWTVIAAKWIPGTTHYPIDLSMCIFLFAAFWFRRYFLSSEQTKILAEKLQQANQQKDDFLINTSHELRNPLHGIINITQSVLDDADRSTNDMLKQRLAVQLSVARRMSRMLDDLLDVARLKEERIQLQLQNVSLQGVARGVCEMLRYMIQDKPIQLHVRISDNFPDVRADENRLTQILFNLLHNAVKFTDQGNITIRATVTEGQAHIAVQDTGIGIDVDTQQKLFLPYEQGQHNAARASGGFGLGLSICKQLVELHGGTLSVTSVVGEGSSFTFNLPLAEAIGQHKSELQPPKHSSSLTESLLAYRDIETAAAIEKREPLLTSPYSFNKKATIIAVDDDSVNLGIISDILGHAQYEIITVTNAAEAIRMLESTQADLVISDVMMPHMSGYELTRTIRERYNISELPVLLLTARNRPEDIYAGFQSGANDYVTKPMDARELRARVHALTELKLSIEERLRMEAAWLQAQIQPHFLYNTLNSIAALSTMDIVKMQRLLEEFSHYLRTSFDFHNTDHVIAIERELGLVRSYLYIEKERFGDRLKVEWEVDEGLSALLPPLSIQTLVENAVNHGILRKASGGTLYVCVRDRNETVEVSVRDNGSGMPGEIVQQVLGKSTGAGIGVGLSNTDRRLKQLYGKGLHIQSAPSTGTTVSFHIPKKA